MRDFISITFLLVFITACINKHSYPINPGDIRQLEIIMQEDSVFRKVSPEEYSAFANQWNNAKAQGLIKYYAQFRIKVTLQNDSVMNFRASGASIKFNNDSTYEVDDKLYFQNLWKSAR